MNTYREKHNLRSPDLSKRRYDDECDVLTEGVVDVRDMFESGKVFGVPVPTDTQRNKDTKKYLWVVMADSVPSALELSKNAIKKFRRKRLTHTNLTGCEEAFCAGEMWFKSDRIIYISGASSRYAPRSKDELTDVCDAFLRLGYKEVKSLGWDDDAGIPHRTLRD
jgi:hypothetical protein